KRPPSLLLGPAQLLSSWYNAGGAAAPTTTPEPPPHVPPNCPPCAGATLTAWTPDPSIWRPDQQAGSPMCSTAGALLECFTDRIVVFVLDTWVAVAVSPVLVETRIVPHESPCLFILLFFSLRVAKEKRACLAGGACGR
ncbi:hypothetical protein JOQ06_007588, partial [Pogonophryne albipinna]